MKQVDVHNVPADAQLIDVREQHEFAQVHAVGAKNIPMGEIIERFNELDLDRDIYLICKSGVRSQHVLEYLEMRGVDAINVEGGTQAWVAAGLPHE